MEQFQIESKKKIRFFFTSIYEPQSVFNAFLRIFEVIIPENLSEKLVGQIEQYASIKFTSKNVDVLDLKTEDEKEIEQEEAIVQTNFARAEEQTAVNQQKIAGDLDALMHIQSLMQQASVSSKDSEADFPERAKFQALANLQKYIKEGMAEQIQVYHNRSLSYISEVFQEEIFTDVSLEKPEKNVIKEQTSKQILDALQKQIKQKHPHEEKISELIEESIEETKPLTTVARTVEGFSEFYGIDRDAAESIINHNFVDVFNELVMRSNIPMDTVLQVLLINIPFLKVLGNDISVITDHVIIQVFKYFLIGTINENEIYQSLDYFSKNPDTPLDTVINEILKRRGEN